VTPEIKVLQVSTSGITQKALLRPLVDRLLQEGYRVHLTCSGDSHAREMARLGYRLTPIRIDRRIHPLSNLRSTRELAQFMARERFHIVHVHTPVASVVGRLAARLARVPVVIYTAHGFYFHEKMAEVPKRAIIWLERALGRITDMLLTQSQEDADTAVRERICPPHKVRWIGNGVDIGRFSASAYQGQRWPGLSPQDRVVGFVGRMVGEKGIVELVQAMEVVAREVPEAKLMLVGDTLDDDRDRGTKEVLRRMIYQNGLAPRVLFTGFVDDIPRAMASMDLFVLPSYREGMPRSIIEAMASGKPVVATDIRGCREEVVDGLTGLLVPPRDWRALAQAIVQILSRPELARRMGEAGRKRAQELFDERQVLDRELEVYSYLVRTRLEGGVWSPRGSWISRSRR